MPPPSSPDYSRGMLATETLEFLLVPLRGAPIVLIPIFSALLLIAAGGGLPGLALIVLSWLAGFWLFAARWTPGAGGALIWA